MSNGGVMRRGGKLIIRNSGMRLEREKAHESGNDADRNPHFHCSGFNPPSPRPVATGNTKRA